jgi:hypothetical protein
LDSVQLAVDQHGLGLQHGVVVNQLVALHGVLDGGEQFLAQPGFDDEAVDFALVDRFDHRVETEHGGDQDARGVGLQLLGLGEKFQARNARACDCPR